MSVAFDKLISNLDLISRNYSNIDPTPGKSLNIETTKCIPQNRHHNIHIVRTHFSYHK